MNMINSSDLKRFIIDRVGSNLTFNDAQNLNIEDEYKEAVCELDENSLDIEAILENDDLYEQFATLYVTEKEEKLTAKDKEQEKAEQTQVKDKNEAGV